MLAFTMGTAFTVLVFIYLFMPALWLVIMAVDDACDFHDGGLAVVAARTSCYHSCRLRLSNKL